MKKIGAAVRIALAIALLVMVWMNEYWSTALIITSMLIVLELNSLFNEHIEKRLRRLEEIMHL